MFDKTNLILLNHRQQVFFLLCVFIFKYLIRSTLLLLLVSLAGTQGNLLKINGLRIKSGEINMVDMSNNSGRVITNSTEYRFPSKQKTKMNTKNFKDLIDQILLTKPQKHWQSYVNELTEDTSYSWSLIQWFRVDNPQRYYQIEQLKDWCIEESLTLDAMVEALASDIILDQLDREYERATTIYKLGRADA